ncbi:MAG: hypothetical protein AB7S26_09870 [Sandaracinaceae bacterium]
MRGRDAPFAIQIGPTRHNWVDVELRLGEHVEAFRASGATSAEPVKSLVDVGIMAASSVEGAYDVGFWLEPAGWWLASSMRDDHVALRLLFAPRMFPGAARTEPDATREVASCSLERLSFALIVWRAVRRAADDLVEAERTGGWMHAVPNADLDTLRIGLVRSGALRE